MFDGREELTGETTKLYRRHSIHLLTNRYHRPNVAYLVVVAPKTVVGVNRHQLLAQ